MFICMICHKQFGQITGKHLKSHGIATVAEYKTLYPNAETVRKRTDSEETLEKKRIARTGKTHTQEAKDKIGAKHRGKTRTAEEIDKWRTSYAEYLEENGSPMTGKDRGEAFKKRMSEVAKARPPELVQQKLEQMWAARRGSNATDEQRERYSQARLKYMEENPDKLPSKLFNTKPEIEFAKALDELEIQYERNVHIVNRVFDFRLRDMVLIEIDGPYHWNYKMYGNKNMSDSERINLFNEAKKRDMYKNSLASEKGYTVYRIKVESNLPKNWKDQLIEQGFKF
jgi:very-short-patch-repair endonuclease